MTTDEMIDIYIGEINDFLPYEYVEKVKNSSQYKEFVKELEKQENDFIDKLIEQSELDYNLREYLNSLSNKPKRDKERIKPLLQELEKYWLTDHDQRFGQLVYNLARFNNLDMFNAEDDEWLYILQNLNKESNYE